VHLKQVRDAFVSKDYYPALVGASSLGERILNHLALALRDDYSGHEATRHVAKQASIDDWKKCVKVLSGWGVFDGETGRDYLALMRMRHGATHYRSELDSGDAREAALEAVKLLCSLVERVFNSIGAGGHYFTGPIGRAYVRLDSESDPFVRKFILPARALVSPRFSFLPNTGAPGGFDAYDDPELGTGETPLTDSEFAEPARATPQVAYPFWLRGAAAKATSDGLYLGAPSLAGGRALTMLRHGGPSVWRVTPPRAPTGVRATP